MIQTWLEGSAYWKWESLQGEKQWCCEPVSCRTVFPARLSFPFGQGFGGDPAKHTLYAMPSYAKPSFSSRGGTQHPRTQGSRSRQTEPRRSHRAFQAFHSRAIGFAVTQSPSRKGYAFLLPFQKRPGVPEAAKSGGCCWSHIVKELAGEREALQLGEAT